MTGLRRLPRPETPVDDRVAESGDGGEGRPGGGQRSSDRSRTSAALDTRVLLGASVVLAALSLLGPSGLHYDPWAWLIWGRELAGGGLDTVGGPSWKPLPVLITPVLSLAGGAAPALWLVIARAGAFFGLGLTFRLAHRFVSPAGGPRAGLAAGAVAVGASLVSPDGEARWIRHLLQGNIEGLLVALCLWAVERHLDGHRGQALALGVLAALARPEVWPFLAVYGLWLWRREPHLRGWVAGLIALVGVLWFGGDWWGSGAPLTGAERARVIEPGWDAVSTALGAAAGAVIIPVWVATAAGVLSAWRRREAPVLVLAGGALAYMAVVAVMAVGFGYAALGRFLAPATAALCVVAGIGAVRVVAAVPAARARWAVGVALLVASLAVATPRIGWIARNIDNAAMSDAVMDDLDVALARAGGPDSVLACGDVGIDLSLIEAKTALAWDLGVPVGAVDYRFGGARGVVFTRVGASRDRRYRARVGTGVGRLARTDEWAAYSVGCPTS